MPTPLLLRWLQDPARGEVESLLSDDAQFHSPVQDYLGHAACARVLRQIPAVVREIEPVRELVDGRAVTTFFRGRVADRDVQGVLDEHHDEHGRVVEATLMLRPFAALRAAIAAMQDLLAAEESPGDR